MNITYERIQEKHGAAADRVAQDICNLHGGIGFFDFKSHRGGVDISGCSQATQEEIIALFNGDEDPSEDAKSLVKDHSREELNTMAVELGLDGDSYSTKQELAEAIINKQKEGN